MPQDWYLVIGLAKTGTTAVAMTLRNTLRIEGFCMEPKETAAIAAEAQPRLVIKILFDHWVERPDQLSKFIADSQQSGGLTTIAIVRDPRDEAISRLHYLAYNYFSSHASTEQDHAAWLEVFRRKEEAPQSLGLLEMEKELKARFGAGFLPGRRLYEPYAAFVDALICADRPNTYLLRYEDFIDQSIPEGPLRTLLSGSRDVGPWLRRVHRTGSRGDWQGFLTDQDLAVINKLCEPMLARFGYPLQRQTTSGDRAEAPLSRSTGSDYVDNLIREARRVYAQRQPTG
jgi:hypothetical protein